MKHFLLKTWLIVVCLLVGVGSAWAETKSINGADITGFGSVTNYTEGTYDAGDGFTISSKSAFSTTQFRVAKSKDLTISINSGKITAVTVTVSSSSYKLNASNLTYNSAGTVGSYSNSEGVDEVVFTNSNANIARITKIDITYTTGGSAQTKTLTSISLSGTYPTEFYKNTAFNHNGMTVTAHYSDAEDEDVTTAASWTGYNMSTAGNQTVTVSYTRSSVTKTAQYNINVVSPIYNLPFYESFNTNEGTGGNDDAWSGAIASSDFKSDNVGWEFVQGKGAKNCVKFGTGSAAGSATTPEINYTGNAILSFKAAAWDGKSETTTISLSATNGAVLSQTSVELNKAAWDEYEVTLTGVTPGTQITFAGSDGNNRFFLDEVKIIAQNATISLNAACTDGAFVYGTYSNATNWVVPAELVVSEVCVIDGELAIYSYKTGDVVPANAGVMASATAGGDYTVNLTNNAATASPSGGGNSLVGTGNGITAAEMTQANTEFFRLTMHNGNTIGFWWGAANGAAFDLGANKAYLAVSTDNLGLGGSSNNRGLWFNDNATSINTVETATSSAIFNLQGQRINRVQKGVNIVNGKKVIL